MLTMFLKFPKFVRGKKITATKPIFCFSTISHTYKLGAVSIPSDGNILEAGVPASSINAVANQREPGFDKTFIVNWLLNGKGSQCLHQAMANILLTDHWQVVTLRTV